MRSRTNDGEELLSVPDHFRLMRLGILNSSSILASGSATVLTVPALLHGLGPELYGLWLVALVPAGVATEVLQGLGYAITREIARRDDPASQTPAVVVVVFVLFSLFGAIAALGTGLALLPLLHLSDTIAPLAVPLLVLTSVGVIGEQVLAFAAATFYGLERFGAANLVSMTSTILRAAGLLLLVGVGAHVLLIGAWYEGVAAAVGIVALWPLRKGIRWIATSTGTVRATAAFAVESMLITGIGYAIWEIPRLAVAVIRGPSELVAYHIGSVVPIALSFLGWRAAQVLFPMASAAGSGAAAARTAELAGAGTRWVVVLSAGPSAVLFVIGGTLLDAWIPDHPPSSVLVLRLLALAALVEAAGFACLHVLWGHGHARAVMGATLLVATTAVGASAALTSQFGSPGAAGGMLLAAAAGTTAVLLSARRRLGVRVLPLLRSASGGLGAPLAVSAGVTYLLVTGAGAGWAAAVGAAFAGLLAYALTLYLRGARAEERALLEAALGGLRVRRRK